MPTYQKINDKDIISDGLIIQCDCHDNSHLVSFAEFDNELDREKDPMYPDDFYFTSKLNPEQTFFKRIFIAIKYIFKPNKMGNEWEFNTTMISPNDVMELKKLCERFLIKNGKFIDAFPNTPRPIDSGTEIKGT